MLVEWIKDRLSPWKVGEQSLFSGEQWGEAAVVTGLLSPHLTLTAFLSTSITPIPQGLCGPSLSARNLMITERV